MGRPPIQIQDGLLQEGLPADWGPAEVEAVLGTQAGGSLAHRMLHCLHSVQCTSAWKTNPDTWPQLQSWQLGLGM